MQDLTFHMFSLQVTDSKGHVLYNKEDAEKGKFAFTTEEYDMFEVCFESKMIAGRLTNCVILVSNH